MKNIAKKTVIILSAVLAAVSLFAGGKPSEVTLTASEGAGNSITSGSQPFGAVAAMAVTSAVQDGLDIKDWMRLSPMDLNAKWHFRIKYKDKPDEVRSVDGLIQWKKPINGTDYYYYYVPAENKGNVVQFTPEGAFIRNLKFPVFGFIFLDVQLEPEVQYLKFPVKQGLEWTANSTGTVELLNFFKIKKPAVSKFTVLPEMDTFVAGKPVHVFRIGSSIDKGDGTFDHEEHWYGVDIGLMYQNTEAYILELENFEPGPAVTATAQ